MRKIRIHNVFLTRHTAMLGMDRIDLGRLSRDHQGMRVHDRREVFIDGNGQLARILGRATTGQPPTLFRKDDVRGSLGGNMFDCPISQSAQIQAAEKRFPSAKCDGRNGEVNFIHVAGLNVLPDRLDTAANLDVLRACRFPRLVQRLLDAAGDKMKCRSAQHLDGRPWKMGEDERWRVIRRIVSPPAFPLIVGPIPTNRSEHVPTENEGAEACHGALRKLVIEACIAAFFSEHLTKGPRGKKPLKDLLAVDAERMIQTLSGSRGEAIERDTEPGNFDLSH